jgi:serine/threonine protein kinase
MKPMTSTTVCLSEDTVTAFIEGRLDEAARDALDRHIDICPRCRILVVHAARSLPPEPPALEELLRFEVERRRAVRLNVGQVVAQRYEVLAFIGRGGMGEVYEVLDLALGERVALKTVTSLAGESPTAMRRLKREVLLARRVTHPNVCRIFDFGVHEGLPFLSMELLGGETLRARVQRGGAFAEGRALPIARELSSALDAAHRAGVIHRDFKGDNVMLVRDGVGEHERAVVMDFGLARSDSDEFATTRSAGERSGLVGTPSHMAPEQIAGGDVTVRTDVYALGIVLYELVTGELPFLGRTTEEMVRARMEGPPRPPSARAPHLSLVWDTVLLRCLERNPERRYASTLEVFEALCAPEGVGVRSVAAAGPSSAPLSSNASSSENPSWPVRVLRALTSRRPPKS